jgi:hypothetical protein
MAREKPREERSLMDRLLNRATEELRELSGEQDAAEHKTAAAHKAPAAHKTTAEHKTTAASKAPAEHKAPAAAHKTTAEHKTTGERKMATEKTTTASKAAAKDVDEEVAKHVSGETHRYVVHFPPHPARTDDPHYKDFNAYHRKHRAEARCYIGERVGYHDCRDEKGTPCPAPKTGEQAGLELHHSHVEFSLQHGVSLNALEQDYPGITNKEAVGDWIESDANFRWLCVFHHRGPGGAHTASHSDWEAQQYVLGLISAEPKPAK